MKRVLLLDDHVDEARDLATQLRGRGWHVTIVHTARAAFDAIPHVQPDAIITELALPDAQGLHVARALRSMLEHDVVVVALTRDADRISQHAIAAGFDHVARKPAHVDALHARMEDLAARAA
ncbi:MAG: response regulator [Deltaproteobacteria bacterium]|nr:response regulator [Deltaproteobacteria bacterium]